VQLENKAAFLGGKEVVCYHVHWSYLLDWLRLKAAGYIELRPGIPPTPKHKQAIIQLMQEKQIPVVIVSSWKEPTKAREVADAANAELVILPGEVDALDDTETYFTWIEYMVTHLIDAFPADEQRKEPLRRIRQRERKRGTK
jgi:ABC-type Zn uptake system ZnuABC Zn-binding protein ZnuA